MSRQFNRGSYNPQQARQFNGYAPAPYSANHQQPKKRSGAKFTKCEGGIVVVSAWKVSKGQMITMYARPYAKTKVTESKSGTKWANLFVTITNKTTMQITNCSGLLDVAGNRLYISDFNLIATKGGKGGYFGRHLGGQK